MHSRLGKSLSLASLSALLSAGSALADDDEVWRVFVADHEAPEVRVIDLDGKALGTFPTRAPASLAIGPGGTVVYAIQRDADIVEAIDSGLHFDDHGDHADVEVEAPAMLGHVMEGDKPVHFVAHDDTIAVFYDDEGTAKIYSERGLAEGAAPRIVTTEAAHHGVAATIGDFVLVSVPDPVDPTNLPIGLRVLDEAGRPVGEDHACPDLHGEAASGSMMAFACAAGILIVLPGADGPSIRLLPYADDLPEGKSTTLLGGVGIQYFVGNYGADAIVVIDPSVDGFTEIRLPMRRVHFAVDRERPQFVYAITEDGQLHRINVLTGMIEKSIPATAPYSMDGHWSDPRPRIAVAGDSILVTEPLAGTIHVVDAESLTASREIAVPGKPFNIVAVGGHGERHQHH